MTITTYTRLSAYEREKISRGLVDGRSKRYIAKALNRSISTISEEARRGSKKHGWYCADCAQYAAEQRARKRRLGKQKLTHNEALRIYVMEKLAHLWSPEQIVERLKQDYPHDNTMRIAPETIYATLYVQPKKELRLLLRHGHLYRRKRGRPRKDETRGKIKDMTLIDDRPEEVVDRLVPGHWEGDIIKGKQNRSALGVLVERMTRYTILVPLAGFDAKTVRRAFAKELLALPQDIRRSLTYDQGKEMAEHLTFTLHTGIKVYFAHSGSPWERGTSENTNGLIRQFFPKGTDFSKVSRKHIKRIQALLNDRPRKALKFRKPDEALQEVFG